MPQGFSRPNSAVPNPFQLRQSLGYIPARDAQVSAASTPGFSITGGPTQPVISFNIQLTLDSISAVRGSLLYRAAGGWVALAPGASGSYLKTLGAGTDPVWAPGSAGGRPVLTGNLTYYVSTTGNDSSDGLTPATALLTGQAAVNKAAAFDLANFTVTVQFANGTYAGQIVVRDGLWPTGKLVLQGDTVTPANVVFNGTGLTVMVAAVGNTATVHVQGFKFTGTGLTAFVYAQNGGTLFYGKCEFTAGANHQVYGNGGICSAESTYTISGGGTSHLRADFGGQVQLSSILGITLTGTPAFTVGFAFALIGGLIVANGATFTGGATGPRYDVESNAVVYTNTGGAAFFPGSVAGVSSTGGQYV